MIDNAALENILETATDISVVCEVYDSDAIPTSDGLDPEDALDCFAAVGGITYRTRTYKRLVEKFGTIKRTLTGEINSASVTFSNVTREISDFEFTNGFEGLILVIRLISRSQSTLLTDSQILFTGRCQKVDSGDKESLTVAAKFVIGSLNVMIPRRTFSADDPEGRVPSDPEFEGFITRKIYGTTTYPRIEKSGGFLGWWNRKVVKATLHWSSYSDVDEKTPVPEVFGRAQVLGINFNYIDVGSNLQVRTAFCEGEIEDIVNERSIDSTLPIHAVDRAYLMGLVGSLNGPDDPGWAGTSGYFSRTAHMRLKITNSSMEVEDPAPGIAAVIFGRKLTVPDAAGDWVDYAWTNNAAAQVVYLITSPDYYKLDENWIDYDYATECFDYNREEIFNTSISDFVFVEPA